MLAFFLQRRFMGDGRFGGGIVNEPKLRLEPAAFNDGLLSYPKVRLEPAAFKQVFKHRVMGYV